jgi:hypothetical protein
MLLASSRSLKWIYEQVQKRKSPVNQELGFQFAEKFKFLKKDKFKVHFFVVVKDFITLEQELWYFDRFSVKFTLYNERHVM